MIKPKISRQASDVAQMNKVLSQNLIRSLKEFKKEVEIICEQSRCLNCWSNALQAYESAKLISEIFVDLYASIHFSGCALYKYADMALRSALENSLNLAYFVNHPVEFGWWEKGKEWYLESKVQHPWGEAYSYFKYLGSGLSNSKASERLVTHISSEYKELSKSIHSSSLRLQTGGAKLSPSVDIKRFESWSRRIQKIVSVINALLILACNKQFRDMTKSDKNLVLSAIIKEHKTLLQSMDLL